MAEESLKNKAVKGVGWSFVDNIAGSGITFLVGLVLARILSPAEFGTLGILMIFIAISNSIVDSGFSNALIRKPDATEEDYNTVFYVNMALAAAMYILLFFSAPAIAGFFKSDILVSTLRVLSTILFFNAASIIQRTNLVKKIDFKTQAKVSIISSLISAVVGIGMALTGYGVWSLVGQQLSRQIANAIFLWIFNHWTPKRVYSWKSFRELFGFGSKLLISGLLNTIYDNIYQFVIGKFYSKADLGQYTRAQQFNTIFSSNLTAVIQRVSFPTLSNIQDDAERLKAGYRKIITLSMVISFACMLALAAISKPMIIILIGEKWMPAILFLQIMCLYGMLYPIQALNLNMLQVKGRSDLFLYLEIAKKIIGIIPVILGILYGIAIMLLASVGTSIIAYFLNSYYSGKLIGYSSWQQIKDISKPFLISAIASIPAWLLQFTNLPIVAMLTLQIIIIATLTIGLYNIFARDLMYEILSILATFTSKLKRR